MRYFGYRPEDTYGVEKTTSNPVRYLQMGKCTLDAPSDPNLEVPTFEETPSRIKRGLYSPSGDLEVALDINSICEFLYLCFGTEMTAGTAQSGLKYLIYRKLAFGKVTDILILKSNDVDSLLMLGNI